MGLAEYLFGKLCTKIISDKRDESCENVFGHQKLKEPGGWIITVLGRVTPGCCVKFSKYHKIS